MGCIKSSGQWKWCPFLRAEGALLKKKARGVLQLRGVAAQGVFW